MKTLLAIIAALVLTACVSENGQPEFVLQKGDKLPAFAVAMSDGTTVSDRSLRGDSALIVFFDSKCPDCVRELPLVQEYADAHPRVKVVCIAREDTAPEQLWRELELSLPYSPQADRRVYNLFANIGVPRYFLVAPDGRIVGKG